MIPIELPNAEIFTFLFNTGLTELAFIFPSFRSKIINCQLKLINELVKLLSNVGSFNINNIDFMKTITSNSIVVNVDANKACHVLVPILFGMLRSFGRVSGINGTSILSLIFHDYHLKQYINNKKNNSKGNKTEILESLNNSRFNLVYEKIFQSSSLNLADYLNPILGNIEIGFNQVIKKNENTDSTASSFVLNPNLEQYFKYTIGSSFYNALSSYTLVLSHGELKDLCQILKKLFTKNVINQMNRHLIDFIASREVIFN